VPSPNQFSSNHPSRESVLASPYTQKPSNCDPAMAEQKQILAMSIQILKISQISREEIDMQKSIVQFLNVIVWWYS
jgi:hypothetical protein